MISTGSFVAKFKAYLSLTKPGIIRGNVMVAGAAFLFASGKHIDFGLLGWLLLGTSLIIASSCVFNNYFDRGIDSKMQRTKNRALVTGSIASAQAIIFGLLLGILGYLVLLRYTNNLTAFVGFLGMFFYLAIYTPAKHKTKYATMLGSLAGAIPPVAGYAAATNRIDGAAGVLFVIMAIWQMPHFYAISIFRKKEYAAAKVPVWSVAHSMQSTQKQIIGLVVAFMLAAPLLGIFGFAGVSYTALMSLTGLAWLRVSLNGYPDSVPEKWAKKVFGFSLLTLLIFSLALSLNPWLP